jgi:hypothetical protein
MTTHTIGTQTEWLAVRKWLLIREKDTRGSDELAR